jgi:L-alanine-DL-glutamate epimerase-like enolase superfamily enzyme
MAAGKKERLLITKVETTTVVVPMKPDSTTDPETSESARFDLVPKVILKVHTDSGITGIGESGRGENQAAIRRNADYLQGKSALDFDLARLKFDNRAGYAAFEMALYDVVGRRLDGRSTSCWEVWPSARSWSVLTGRKPGRACGG